MLRVHSAGLKALARHVARCAWNRSQPAGRQPPITRSPWSLALCADRPLLAFPGFNDSDQPVSRSGLAVLFMPRRLATMAAPSMAKRMIWVDLEMTGLDIEKDKIIEMACIITDSDLNILAEGPHLIINQPNELLDGMSDWCTEHHGNSGLTQAVRNSKISLQQAEYEFLSFVRQHTPPGLCPLAGNSVHADKKFLDKYMPQFMRHLHYRIIDVSTIKELCRRWYPDEYEDAPKKKASHRALDDIQESIKELQFYRIHVFKETNTDEKMIKTHLENGDNSKRES